MKKIELKIGLFGANTEGSYGLVQTVIEDKKVKFKCETELESFRAVMAGFMILKKYISKSLQKLRKS